MVSARSEIFGCIAMKQLIQPLQEIGEPFVIVRKLEHCLPSFPAVIFQLDGASQLLSPFSILRSSFRFAHVSGSAPLTATGRTMFRAKIVARKCA